MACRTSAGRPAWSDWQGRGSPFRRSFLIDAMSAGRAFRVTDRKNLRSLAVGFEFAIADATRSPANQARLIMKKSTKSQKPAAPQATPAKKTVEPTDRKSTRLNSSHVKISYAVFCLKKKKKTNQ